MRFPSSIEGSGAVHMIMATAVTFWLAWGKTSVSLLPCWV
jgi:hypothetical protein